MIAELIFGIIIVVVFLLFVLWILFYKLDVLKSNMICDICDNSYKKINSIITDEGKKYNVCDDCETVCKFLVANDDVLKYYDKLYLHEKEKKKSKIKKGKKVISSRLIKGDGIDAREDDDEIETEIDTE